MARAALKASNLSKVLRTGAKAPLPDKETLKFGTLFTDHMMEVDWESGCGWKSPVIKPLANLSLHPATSSLHYGIQAFEGMKAFRSMTDDNIYLFRPNLNAERLNRSCQRIALPSFDETEFLKLVKELVKVDERWVPSGDGYSLYIRPTCISTQDSLGVAAPDKAKLYVILSPVGPYFASGFKPVKLLASTKYARAFPGGVGDFKVGGNYAPTIQPAVDAAADGLTNILWLYPRGDDYEMTECGAMNFFLLWKNKEGQRELITPPLSKGLILPGVTRNSILALAKTIPDLKVKEGDILMKKDFIPAFNEGRIIETFAAGTAVNVCSVDQIVFENVKYNVPVDANVGIGEFAGDLRRKLQDIQHGHIKHEWNVALED